MSQYPEHDKMRAIADESQTIAEFLMWLTDTKAIHLAQYDPSSIHGRTFAVNTPTTDLLAEFYGIDLAVVEAEKRAMLDSIRQANS